ANLAWLSIGAVGMVSGVAHVAAREYVEMVRAVDAGDLELARPIDRRVIPAVKGILTRTQGALAAKTAMQLLGVIPSRTMRQPLPTAGEEWVEQLRSDLQQAGIAPADQPQPGASPSGPV